MSKPNFGEHYIEIKDSSLAGQVYFDPDSFIMDVVFKSGGRYRYEHVSARMFCRFVLAKSMGKFFHEKIRNRPKKYPFKKL